MKTIDLTPEFVLAIDDVKTGEKPFESLYQTKTYKEMLAACPGREADLDLVIRKTMRSLPAMTPTLRKEFTSLFGGSNVS